MDERTSFLSFFSCSIFCSFFVFSFHCLISSSTLSFVPSFLPLLLLLLLLKKENIEEEDGDGAELSLGEHSP